MRRSLRASSFGATLELVREGKIELRQTEPFAPLYIRDRAPVAPVMQEAANG
jgi:segregation and condensation protein A